MPAEFFTPADGEKGRAKRLAELVSERAPGDAITYSEAQELLDCDRAAAQSAMRDAMAMLERAGKRSVRTVTNFGWVVMVAGEHIDAAGHHLAKSRNAARRSLRKVKPLDRMRNELTQEQRWAADQARLAAAAVEAMASRSRKSFTSLIATAKPTALPPIGRAG